MAAAIALERLAILSGQFGCSAPASSWQSQGPQVTGNPSAPVVIVGGVVLDIQARPDAVDVQRGGSVPGQVRQVPGGVGRNIADAIRQLLPPSHPAPVMVGLLGDDAAGAFLLSTLRTLRLDTSCLLTLPSVSTPCVTVVFDRSGEVAACIADVASVETQLTPQRLSAFRPHIQSARLLVAETNLSAEALQEVCTAAAQAQVPVFLEPVSVPKSRRLAPVLRHATFVSPNAAELIAMADEVRERKGLPLLPRPNLDMVVPVEMEGVSSVGQQRAGSTTTGSIIYLEGTPSSSGRVIGNDSASSSSAGAGSTAGPMVSALLQQLGAFAAVLLAEGTQYVVLTMGALGSALISRDPSAAAVQHQQHPEPSPTDQAHGASVSHSGTAMSVDVVHLQALPADVVSVSGAGDTLVAGMVAALVQGRGPLEALAYGTAAAKRAVESLRNVPEGLEYAKLSPGAATILATARRHVFEYTLAC